ncbi:MAG: nuclear transport factor 2 family protein [Dermatophilaceae bacterium]
MDTTVPAPVRTYITASNAFDGAGVIAAFTDDAVVNDARREFWGSSAIRAWLDREIIGDKVTRTSPPPANNPGWSASTP